MKRTEVLDDFCDSQGRQVEAFVECSVPGQFTGELNLFLGCLCVRFENFFVCT